MLEDLLTATPPLPHQTTGQWRTVRMCIDTAAQEWLNVGVVFHNTDGKRHWRLLHNLAALRCLYNDDVADNAQFLIEQARYALETCAALPSGWNVALGPAKFVRGLSAEAIVHGLFVRMVPMSRYELTHADRTDREGHRYATNNVRASVRNILSKMLEGSRKVPGFWCTGPVSARRDNMDITVDLQIAAQRGNVTHYGSITSAWYKTRYHRAASLSQAAAAITTARQAFTGDVHTLYLLQPPKNAPDLSKQDHAEIEQDVANLRYLVQQAKASLRFDQSETGIANKILEDLELVPPIH